MSASNAGDPSSIPGSGRCPGEENGNPLQFLARRIPWMEKPGIAKSQTTSLSLSFILNLIKAILRRTKLEISYCLISNYTTKL